MTSPPTNGKISFKMIDYLATLLVPIGLLSAGLLIILFQKISPVIPTLMWAFACLVLGAVVGFLFGIPRAIQQDDSNPADQQRGYRQKVNTNLEQISDWLTKIIVGVGLVELRRVPELLNRASEFVSKGIGGTPEAQVLAASIIIFFVVLGFMSCYLSTRVYLSGTFTRAAADD
jgi:hypothetical protein